MRTERRGPWGIAAGLLVVGAVGCQTIVYADRSLIPDGGGEGGGEADAGRDCGEGGDGPVVVGVELGAGGQGGECQPAGGEGR